VCVSIAEQAWSVFMETLNERDELTTQLLSLKQNSAFQHILRNLEIWRAQAASDMADTLPSDPKMYQLQAEFKVYGRTLNIVDRLIQDLTLEAPKTKNFDAYNQSEQLNPKE
jgi:hypothetical protein